MFRGKHQKEISFFEVAVGVIFIGAFLFAFGVVGWILNYFSGSDLTYQLFKIVAGVIIIALGYIIVELDWTRREK